MDPIANLHQSLSYFMSAKSTYNACEQKASFFHSLSPNGSTSDLKNVLSANINQVKDLYKEFEDLYDGLEMLIEKANEVDRLDAKNKSLIEKLSIEIEKDEKKLKNAETILEKVDKQNDFDSKYRQEFINNQTHESQMNILNNDCKIMDLFFKVETILFESMTNYTDKINSEDALIRKNTINAYCNGLSVVEDNSSDDKSSWFEIQFLNLPDDCVDEQHYGSYPESLKQVLSQLSPAFTDKYRSIFKKRKTKNNETKSSVVVNNLADFQILYDNFPLLWCNEMTKIEIHEASSKVPIDWIPGSKLVTIILDSKSKMANIVLPTYYPLTGTSRIKLININGFESSEIKKFHPERNCGSLYEWIQCFIDLYNKHNQKDQS